MLKDKIGEWIAIETRRIPLFYPVILSLAILYGVYFPLPSFICVVLVCFALVLISFFLCRYARYCFLVFSLGLYVSQTGGILRTMPLLVDKTYITEQIEKTSFYADVGFIEETHPTMKNMQRLILKNIRFCESKDSENYDSVNTVKMTCGTRMLRGIQPLDAVKVVGSLLPLKGPVIPGSFDPKQYNSIMGIDATGVVFYLRKLSSNTKHSNFTEIFSYLRFHLTKAISGRLHGEASGVVSALLTGDKSSISSETRDKFIKSGTAHVLAISGLHMSIVTFIIFSIIKRLLMYVCCIIGRTIGFRAIAAFITIPFTFVYLALSGFSPSATRAFIMTSICMISIMIGRRAMSIRNISTAALLILVLDPGALFHVSFQLSFSAVLALLAFYEKYNSLLPYRPSVSWKILSYILSSMIMTTIATIATTPISVATFNRFSAQNLFGNLIAVPIVSFLIAPLGIANIVICKFTNILIKPLQLSIDAMIRAMGVISSLPGSEIALKTPAQYIMWFIIIGGILLCFLISKLRYIGGGFIGAGFFCYIFVQKSPYLIVVPNDDGIVCMIENGTVYANSNQKGRPKIYSIMRTLGLKEEPNGNNSKGNNSKGNNSKGNNIVKRDLISGLKLFTNQSIIRELKTKNFSNEEGFFLWRDGKVRHIKQRKHPYCPAFYYAKALE